LDIDKNVTIYGGTKIEDYPKEQDKWHEVVAEGEADVGIIGGRKINGQGLKFVKVFNERKNVMFALTQNTSVEDVTIYGNFNSPNIDGIDIEDSNNTSQDAKLTPDLSITSPQQTPGFQQNPQQSSLAGLAGNVSDITFSNINISTRYYDPSWWGKAEPIYVTTCPRDRNSKEGSISNLQFINITATSENGIFLSGSRHGMLSNLKFFNVNLTYTRWTNYSGGMLDYRPGCQGLVNHSTAGFVVEHIDGVDVQNVNMRWSSEDNSGRWKNNPIEFRPSTVNNISFLNFHSGLCSG
ncbi:hypothetical protein ACH5RR_002688, partial [Cinchona calisaya]